MTDMFVVREKGSDVLSTPDRNRAIAVAMALGKSASVWFVSYTTRTVETNVLVSNDKVSRLGSRTVKWGTRAGGQSSRVLSHKLPDRKVESRVW